MPAQHSLRLIRNPIIWSIHRYHLQVAQPRSPEDKATHGEFSQFMHRWQKVVDAYMDGQDDTGTGRVYVSEMQFLLSDTGSASQFWHSDNTLGGLTFIVPLVDITTSNGTEIMPSSASWTKYIPHWANRYLIHLNTPISWLASVGLVDTVTPVVKAGDAVIFDARCLHRGKGNAGGNPRPILVFRYDFTHRRAPGR